MQPLCDDDDRDRNGDEDDQITKNGNFMHGHKLLGNRERGTGTEALYRDNDDSSLRSE
jgi:hypothetical protein